MKNAFRYIRSSGNMALMLPILKVRSPELTIEALERERDGRR
jgi:hypothetical protein